MNAQLGHVGTGGSGQGEGRGRWVLSTEGQPRGESGTTEQRFQVESCAAISSSYFSLEGRMRFPRPEKPLALRAAKKPLSSSSNHFAPYFSPL